MKDLKHLIYFEDLLREANNDLVKQAVKDGRKVLGYTCYFIPEVLLNLPGCVSVRLRAPGATSLDLSTYYMSNKVCLFTRSILERALEGGYPFLSALFSGETCQMMHRGHEHFEILHLVDNPDFFLSMMDVPFVDDDDAVEYYARMLRKYILKPLSEVYGIDTGEEALRQAVADHNELCAILTELSEMRKLDNPPITGYEFHVLQLVSECCPQYLVLDKLRQTLKEVKRRKPDPEPWYRVRVVVAGSEVDDPAFTALMESCGIFVAADRYCYGSFPGRETIELIDGEDPVLTIARHYLRSSQCARFMNTENVNARKEYVRKLAEEYRADGVIYLQMKFCEYWSYERVLGVHVLNDEMGIPTIGLEKEYDLSSAGQLRTRFQAFVESLEIKKISGGEKK